MKNNIIINTAIRNLEAEYSKLNKLLPDLSDEKLLEEVSNGKNRGIYLLGHLVASNDSIRPLLNLGEKLYPNLESIFISSPDKSGQIIPTAFQIKEMWEKVSDTTLEEIKKLSEEEWFEKHNAVSEKDFIKEPNRNKISIILSRTIHQAYHTGQIALLIKKENSKVERRYPIPPFNLETATQKVKMAQDAWNTKNPEKVSLAYTTDTEWRNRNLFINGRNEVVSFLTAKWDKELDYKLRKELWAYSDNKIAVRFEYEWRNESGQWFRSYGNENWEFDENGLMKKRFASINDLEIDENEKTI
jgi:uncharacterized protein